MPKLTKSVTEKFQWLSIKDGVSYLFKCGYSLPVSAKKDDIIQVSFRSEFTNPQNYTAEVGSYIVLGSTDTDIAQSKSICAATGENVTPAMHHIVVNGTCNHQFKEDFSGFVNVVFYSNSTAAQSGQQIELMQGYGYLDVLQFDNEVSVAPQPDTNISMTVAQKQQIMSVMENCTGQLATITALLQQM